MPYVSVWVDTPELSAFSDADLIEELESRGFGVAKGTSIEGIGRIEHLAACGFVRDAAIEALQLIECQLGRPGILTRTH